MRFATRRVPARIGELGAANAYVEACAVEAGRDARTRFGLQLALEEAFVNVCHYGYPDGPGDVAVTCETDGPRFVLEVADWGPPFDVLALPAPDLTLGIDERPIGGLGVHLIRTLARGVEYRRDEGRNVLRMMF
jgi:anti-sigma regulatory factor (Ser/Thr protein kinase)